MIQYYFKKYGLRILCYILSAVLCFSIGLTIVFSSILLTVGNYKYCSRAFDNPSMTQSLEDKLDAKLTVIADENGVPLEAIKKTLNTSAGVSAQKHMCRSMTNLLPVNLSQVMELDETMRTNLKHYSDKKGLKLSDKKIDTVTQQSLAAFDETYSITNLRQFAYIYSFMKGVAPKLVFLMVFMIVASTVLIAWFNNFRKKALAFFGMVFAVTGELMVVMPVLLYGGYGYIFDQLTNIAEYNNAIRHVFFPLLIVYAVIGVVFLCVGISMFVECYMHYKIKSERKQSEKKIQEDLIF